jgi:hypothetical protein
LPAFPVLHPPPGAPPPPCAVGHLTSFVRRREGPHLLLAPPRSAPSSSLADAAPPRPTFFFPRRWEAPPHLLPSSAPRLPAPPSSCASAAVDYQECHASTVSGPPAFREPVNLHRCESGDAQPGSSHAYPVIHGISHTRPPSVDHFLRCNFFLFLFLNSGQIHIAKKSQ